MKMTAKEISAFLAAEFPQIDGEFVVEQVDADDIVMRLPVQDRHLRPGGTVSGPSMFALADVTVYALVLSRLGREALAVTTNCSLDFMRKPEAGRDIVARGQLLKLGRTLAIGDVHMFSAGSDTLVARSTMTYSIPPKG